MADLDEALKPRVEGPNVMDFYGEFVSGWKIPVTHYHPPHGRKSFDTQPTLHKDVAEKAQKILDAGFHFTFEILRMVNRGSFCIVGMMQYSADEEPEENDVAIVITNPDRSHLDAVDKCIRDFVLPEDGSNVVRRY